MKYPHKIINQTLGVSLLLVISIISASYADMTGRAEFFGIHGQKIYGGDFWPRVLSSIQTHYIEYILFVLVFSGIQTVLAKTHKKIKNFTPFFVFLFFISVNTIQMVIFLFYHYNR